MQVAVSQSILYDRLVSLSPRGLVYDGLKLLARILKNDGLPFWLLTRNDSGQYPSVFNQLPPPSAFPLSVIQPELKAIKLSIKKKRRMKA